jgi:hypothetical protein
VKKQAIVLALILALAVLFSAAQAPVSEPPPDLQGQASTHLWTVPGVMNADHVTVFACTNVSTRSIIVGVEVFDADGTSLNDPSATSLAVDPGGTVMFGTSIAGIFFLDSELMPGGGPFVTKGSARVLATSKSDIICSAFLTDRATSPSMVSLSVVKKTAQQGD